jgi:hypothetical protein
MDLRLTFHQGVLSGDGHDRIGAFLIRGKYTVDDGKCWWTKSYIGRHDVFYQGYNEGKGIWGLWDIPPNYRGGFHIWPVGMPDPTQPRLAESIDQPTTPESTPAPDPPAAVPSLEPERTEEPLEVAEPA